MKERVAPREPVEPLGSVEPADGHAVLAPEVVQVPAQPALDGGALAHEILAVIEQQLDLERPLVELGRGQCPETLPQRRAGDRRRVDRVGLARLAGGSTLTCHQLGSDPHDPL